MHAQEYGANSSSSSPQKGSHITIRLTARQAQLVKERVQTDLSELVRNTVPGSGHLMSHSDIDGLRVMLDTREKWLDQLSRPAEAIGGTLTWTAPKAEVAAVAVDLVAKGLHETAVADILEDGEHALDNYVARLWLDMADAALAIRAQLDPRKES